VVNYPDEAVPYTRITEYKHLTGQRSGRTSITREYPTEVGDPYYPIPRDENLALYRRYEAAARAEPAVTFVGRLATYRYYNMDQIVGQALATFRRLVPQLRPTSMWAPDARAMPFPAGEAAAAS
jgi:UDP-galactopyranose mutase